MYGKGNILGVFYPLKKPEARYKKARPIRNLIHKRLSQLEAPKKQVQNITKH